MLENDNSFQDTEKNCHCRHNQNFYLEHRPTSIVILDKKKAHEMGLTSKDRSQYNCSQYICQNITHLLQYFVI